MEWESAERVQKNDAGEFRALIGGEWIPVAKAQKNDSGEFRVMRNAEPQELPKPKFENVGESTFVDRAALATDRILKSLGSTLPDFLPSRQNIVNLSAGMVPGGLENAPRIKNVATEDGWRTAGRMARPAETLLGIKAFQAATALPKVAAMSPLMQNIVGGGAAGAVGGGLSGEPVQGTAMGMAMGAAFRPLEWLGDKALALASRIKAGSEGQVITFLNDVFGGDKFKVAQALDELKSLVPGERPTAGMAAPNIDSVKLAALESGVASRPYASEQLAARRAANRAARDEAFQRRAAPLQVLEQSRSDITSPMYQAANRQLVNVDDTLETILQGADVNSIMNKVVPSMQQGQINALVAGRNTVPTRTLGSPAPITDFAVEFGGVPQGATAPQMSVEALQRLKSAIDGEINAASRNAKSPLGLENLNLRQLKEARGQLIEWINVASPMHKAARETFAAMSPPINQAKLFGSLRNSINAPLVSEGRSQLNTAINNLPQTFQRSTGVNRFSTPEDVISSLSPLGQRTLRNVEQSMEREAAAQAMGANQGVLPQMTSAFETIESAVPPVLKTAVTLLRRAATLSGKAMDKEAQAILDRAILEPRVLAAMLREVPPAERSQVVNWLKNNKPEVLGADISVLTGLLSDNKPKRMNGLLDIQE